MYINTGNNLFLPEGDDYSKTEFDEEMEKAASEGNEVLNQLRAQQMQEKALRVADREKPTKEKSSQKQEENLSFKEIFDSVAGKRK